ncbi:hypothetical protein CS063_00005 [Sporanaerobium hydrogeniformans]|uniref:Uncharacterized protein n=1 Tax=Sporanaerobium hydrogeniformans TaxID=3072179 RepID=A0AC61DGC3_9FIRM|nr:ASCH domain-containing protein [Sporanaerobium hydrogeniformans]PHV71900.1 hypothetical protein CS063_00005 [Sporanaerobium hydrogeniformans]
MDGLIIKEPYIDWILNGEKDLELRGFNTSKRGTIALIKSGTGKIYGTVDIIRTMKIETRNQYEKLRARHCVGTERKNIRYKELWGWELINPVIFKEPIKYSQKKGQQVWVKDAM